MLDTNDMAQMYALKIKSLICKSNTFTVANAQNRKHNNKCNFFLDSL